MSREVLTLFEISGSLGIVILAVIVYGAEGSEKSNGDMLATPTAAK